MSHILSDTDLYVMHNIAIATDQRYIAEERDTTTKERDMATEER